MSLAFLPNDGDLILVLQVYPHVIFGMIVKEMNSNLIDLAFLVLPSELNDSGLQPSAYRMVYVKPVVQLDFFRRLPLLDQSA